jgi:uncharacterized protein (TIGR02118 family)
MFKVAWFARFPQGMAKADARRHWAEIHGPMCKRVPGIERYVQNHVLGALPTMGGTSGEEAVFDGYSCGWWPDRKAYKASMGTPEWAELVEDGYNVFNMAWLANMSAQVEEHPMIEGPMSPYKVVWIVRFKKGMSRAAGRWHWREVHGPIFKSLDIDRYVQNHVVGTIAADVGGAEKLDLGFDGFSECWFKDEGQFLRAIQSPTWAKAVEDGYNVFDMTDLWGARLEERVVKGSRP